MEFDDFKSAWQSLDRQLTRQNMLNFQLLKERKLEKARSSMRPLFIGQVIQMLLGGVLVVMGAVFWNQHLQVPHLLASGLILHVYGVLCIVLSGNTLGLMRRIDPSQPVLDIQNSLLRLRHRYICYGLIVGLPWWLLWVPFLIVAVGLLTGMDLYAIWPGIVPWGLGTGIPGLLGMWWLHHWSRSPQRTHWRKRVDDSMAGGSIVRMQGLLDDIGRFEKE